MTPAKLFQLSIETPEGVTFSFELATPVTRSLAWMIDTVAAMLVAYWASRLVDITGALNPDWAGALGLLLYFAISIGYCIILEWRWSGQTIGKRLLGLRVIDEQGLRLRLPQVVIRNIMRLIDAPPPLLYLIGGIAALSSRKGQRLSDMAANTVVIRERKSTQPDLDRIAPARYNSLLAHPHLAARLRSLARPEAIGLTVRALANRDGYEPFAGAELFAELAAYFRDLVRFPEAALEGLTDEQYLRGVLRVVYGAKQVK